MLIWYNILIEKDKDMLKYRYIYGGHLYMKIAICDDQQIFIDRLRNLIADEDAEIYVFHSGDELLNSNVDFDIVLLDIEMPGTDGLGVAAKLYQKNRKTLLLFITSHREYSTKGYEFRAFRYVLKSEPDDFVKRNIDDAINEYKNYDFYITVNYKGEYARILSTQVTYIEAFGHTITVHTTVKDYIGQNKFKDICRMLAEHGFIQCHKSYIVNMRYIETIEKNSCVNMTDGTKLPIGRKYSADTIEAYLEFMDRRI